MRRQNVDAPADDKMQAAGIARACRNPQDIIQEGGCGDTPYLAEALARSAKRAPTREVVPRLGRSSSVNSTLPIEWVPRSRAAAGSGPGRQLPGHLRPARGPYDDHLCDPSVIRCDDWTNASPKGPGFSRQLETCRQLRLATDWLPPRALGDRREGRSVATKDHPGSTFACRTRCRPGCHGAAGIAPASRRPLKPPVISPS